MSRLFAALACLVCFMEFGACADAVSFAVIGDTPYSASERRELPGMLKQIAGEKPAFIIHAGDIKSSTATCDDDMLLDRHALFDASTVPFVYVPGDNEWKDCTRLAAGHYAEQERLGKLRSLFFAGPESLGQSRITLDRQSDSFPEHLRWRLGSVLFITLNVPGPDNNYGMQALPSKEFTARNPSVIDWLKSAFAQARRDNLAGLVITMQGNPAFRHFAARVAHAGYRELLETLRDETLHFAGQVLLVHGDTHWNRIDRPLRYPESTKAIANFTRIETFGYPFMGWVTITIDADDPALFRFAVNPYKGL